MEHANNIPASPDTKWSPRRELLPISCTTERYFQIGNTRTSRHATGGSCRCPTHGKPKGVFAEVTLIQLLDRVPESGGFRTRRTPEEMHDEQVRLKSLGFLGAGLILAAAPFVSARAADRCDVARTGGEARACAAAAQGPTELRRFVERTRAIYGLYYWDYAPHAEAAAAAAPAPDAAKLASVVTEIDHAVAPK